MPRPKACFITANVLLWGTMLLVCPLVAVAQRHGGGTPGAGGNGWPGISRPDGVDEKDALKDFHHALAVQATSQQVAEFQVLVKNTETARAALQDFQQQLNKKEDASQPALSDSALEQVLNTSRSDTQHFVAGFSDAQKSGLKEITKRLSKVDSDLEQQEKRLDQDLQLAGATASEVAAQVDSLGKALTDFYNEQLALGSEMGIVLASGQDLAFTLPAVKSAAHIADRVVGVIVSGRLSQVAVKGSQRAFKLDLIADFSDLQHNITELLRARLDTSNRCGERVAVREATITPSAPATVVTVQMHLERWACMGQGSATELAESDGTVEIKLTPAVDKSHDLKMVSELGRIEASGMMAQELRSGDLGDDLRDKTRQSLLSALQAAADFKTTLPPVLQSLVTVQSAKFRDAAGGILNAVLEGQIEMSNEQANVLASQLNQTLSAQMAAQ